MQVFLLLAEEEMLSKHFTFSNKETLKELLCNGYNQTCSKNTQLNCEPEKSIHP